MLLQSLRHGKPGHLPLHKGGFGALSSIPATNLPQAMPAEKFIILGKTFAS